MKGCATEGQVRFRAAEGKVCRKMAGFYNPLMEFNRSFTIAVIKALGKEKLRIGLPLAATGIRGLRILKEVPAPHEVHMNDLSSKAAGLIKDNLRLNKLKACVHNEEATKFLLNSEGFNYIDIDPFGSPNPFLDAALRRIARGGILAVTATDTAPLAGTYVKACLRKYWARPLRNDFMHETGLRILIRKVQLVASQYDKAALPLASYYKDHYFRAFFRIEKSKSLCDSLLASHQVLRYSEQALGATDVGEQYGPVYTGRLAEPLFLKKLLEHADAEISSFINLLFKESELDCIGFVGLGTLGRLCKALPKKQELIMRLNTAGHKACSTHFSPQAVKFEGRPHFMQLCAPL
jgi:tRNA (guanine26-N2/guanine27-N2)-dimethyltransferase